MAARKPVVIGANGLFQQIQSGDTLQTPQTAIDVYVVTNNEATPIVIVTPVYIQANDAVKKAKADAIGTSSVFGLVYDASISNGVAGAIQVGGIVSASTAQWDVVTGGSGGLVAGTYYFLSATTAGMLTTTAPSSVGQVNTLVGQAISTTEMQLIVRAPVLL